MPPNGGLHRPLVLPLLPPLPRLLARRPASRGRRGLHEHEGAAAERSPGSVR
jgi:hypothetical protein